MRTIKKWRMALVPLMAILLVAAIAGVAVADGIQVPGTDIVVPLPDLPVPVPDLPEVTEVIPTETVVPIVEDVTTLVVPKADQPVLPAQPEACDLPVSPTEVPAQVTNTLTGAIDNAPVPDLSGKVPEVPIALPDLSTLTDKAGPLLDLVKSLLPGQVYPYMGLVVGTVNTVIRMLPKELTEIPLIRSLLDLLITILSPPAEPAPGTAVNPPVDNTAVVTPATAVTPTVTPETLDGIATANPSYDHLPYTGTDLTLVLLSILGLAGGLLAVRRFEAWLIARR
jgi:hypothetical protein